MVDADGAMHTQNKPAQFQQKTSAKAMKELQANSQVGLVSLHEHDAVYMSLHDRVLSKQVDPRWRRGVDDAVMIVKRDYGTREACIARAAATCRNLQATRLASPRKANNLLESAKEASEAVCSEHLPDQGLPCWLFRVERADTVRERRSRVWCRCFFEFKVALVREPRLVRRSRPS